MYAIIKNSTVVSTSDFEPSLDDLATRNETAIETEELVECGWIYNGTFSPPIAIPPTNEQLMQSIRSKRDALLASTDKMMLSDYPLKVMMEQLLFYRQSLRDFPETCNPSDPQYPIL
jgi:hypothetical protein